MALFGDAALEAFGDQLARQVAADENDPAVALLTGLPRPLMVAIENHVHALKDEALLVVLERENAFAAQNVRPLLLHQVLHKGKEFVRIERLLGVHRNRLHFLVVVVLEPAMRMRVTILVAVMMPMIMIVVVLMIVIVGAEEVRFKIEDTIEVEGVAAEHRVERNFGAFGLVQLGVRIDAANTRLDIA